MTAIINGIEEQPVLSRLEQCCVVKTDGAVLAGSDPLFVITGGPIAITRFFGVVTTSIVDTANCHIDATTVTPAATTALSSDVAIDNDAAGTTYTFTAAAPGVLTPVTNGVQVALGQIAWLMPIGTIYAHCNTARVGVIAWYMVYQPLSPNCLVTAAP
jgi:hypothetical protein